MKTFSIEFTAVATLPLIYALLSVAVRADEIKVVTSGLPPLIWNWCPNMKAPRT